MQIFSDLNEWVKVRNHLPQTLSLGFVPTMGNLHQGHASLFLASSQENSSTLASVFVNPTQFNNKKDLELYPRTIEADVELMANSGVDFCILPKEEDLYADGYAYQIQEKHLSQLMEGKHRPGHFEGVLTVVMKLLHLARPHRAYFGEKDYQQYLLIKGMAKALYMNLEIKACPTLREASGLAYSSRNNRLNPEQRKRAEHFASLFLQNKPCPLLFEELTQAGIQVDYLEEYQNRKFVAAWIDGVRLIDNVIIDKSNSAT